MKRNQFVTNNPPLPKDGCPKCGGEQLCPCVNCARENSGKVVWVWQKDGETIACGHCGFLASADQWMDIEMEYYYRKFKE